MTEGERFRHADLFSGIGGFALAVRWLGGETVGFCEIEEYPQRVLRKNFPGVPIHDDIRTLTGDTIAEWGGCDLITGGFPCQPFSTAGQRRGTDDNRHLWPEMFRVIDECRPRFVLGENVANFANMALDGVCADLESLGYETGTVIVPAVGVGAHHQRHRTWIMAYADREWELQPGGGQREQWEWIGDRGKAVAHAAGQRQPGPGPCGDACHCAPGGEGQAAQLEYGRVGQEWSPEPGVGRVAHGVPSRVDRLAGLGNAIVPQVAYQILSVMMKGVP